MIKFDNDGIIKMRTYFYKTNKLSQKWLESQFNMMRKEDAYYRDAVLAALKLDPLSGNSLSAANNLR